MDATEMFLLRHQRLHRRVDRVLEGLTDQEIRNPVYPGTNPLAWLIWHMARSEDSAVSLLVSDVPQVLTRDWSRRIRIARQDAGTGMTVAEVMDVSASVHLGSLIAYWKAVGERTRGLIASITPLELDQIQDADRIRIAMTAMVTGAVRRELEELFANTSKGHFLVWLALTHSYEHLGQADFIRGMLGRPGRF